VCPLSLRTFCRKTGDSTIAPQAFLVLLIVVALPIAWLASEFGRRRPIRIALGVAAIASTMGVAYIVGDLSRWNYNAWYGGASKELIDTTVTQIEDGNIDRVMSVLRRLKLDYRPTYENRAHYDELINEAVSKMRGDVDLQGSKWDTSPFTRETWVGHWENDTGFWIVINDILDFGVVRSGDDMPKMTNVVVSGDFASLTFTEGDQCRHELTLVNKYEAKHVWHHLDNGTVWQTDTFHKLIRATPAQRPFTQQTN
jgi:hypothetical protein